MIDTPNIRRPVDAIKAELDTIEDQMRDYHAIGRLALEFRAIAERATYLAMTPDERRAYIAERAREAG